MVTWEKQPSFGKYSVQDIYKMKCFYILYTWKDLSNKEVQKLQMKKWTIDDMMDGSTPP